MLSYLHYAPSHRTRISPTNPLERLNLGDPAAHARDRHLPARRRLYAPDRMPLLEKHQDWLTDDKAYLTFDDASVEEGKRLVNRSS